MLSPSPLRDGRLHFHGDLMLTPARSAYPDHCLPPHRTPRWSTFSIRRGQLGGGKGGHRDTAIGQSKPSRVNHWHIPTSSCYTAYIHADPALSIPPRAHLLPPPHLAIAVRTIFSWHSPWQNGAGPATRSSGPRTSPPAADGRWLPAALAPASPPPGVLSLVHIHPPPFGSDPDLFRRLRRPRAAVAPSLPALGAV